MCQLRNFCYCCRLRTGAIFTAMFTFTYAAALLVGGALVLDRAYTFDYHWAEHVSGWSQVASGVVSLFGFIVLVVAICKHRPGLLIPWLVIAIIDILLQLLILALSIRYERWHNLGIIPFTLWFMYLWIIIFSYRKLLKDRYFPATSSPPMLKSNRWENGHH